jgi:hypothetical protein
MREDDDSTVTGLRGDEGMTTAEYAVGTLAACSFAGLLLKLLSSSTVTGWLESLIGKALHMFF